jgi:pseudomonalisin
MRTRRRVPLITLLLAVAALTAAGTAHAATLRGSVVHGLASARSLGHYRRSASRPLVVAVTLKHDLGALYRAEAALYDPNSPSYHQFLTPAQFRARYGTDPGRLAAVRRFVTSKGLRLVHPDVLGDYVMASGSVAQVERTFGVRIDRFRSAGKTFFANTGPAHVRSGLGIDAVLGLEGRNSYHLAGRLVRTSPQTQGGCLPGPTCVGAMSPQDLWSAYDMPADNIGQGQTMAVIGEGQTADVVTALREFEKTRGLPTVPVQVIHTDPGEEKVAESARDDSGRIEWELDSQASTGMAPGVSQLRMYFGSSLQLPELTGSLAYWVGDAQGPLQASASLGLCEDNPALDPLIGADQRADMALLAQAAMEGRTLFASTGDTGSACSFPGQEGVNGVDYGDVPTDEYPAVDPNTVAVGGTSVYTDGAAQPKIVSERAWDHTGGGPSKFVGQPPYQTGASPLLDSNFCLSQADGTPYDTPGQLCRGNADVAALSGDFTELVDHRAHGVLPVDGGNGYDIVDYCPPAATGTGPNSIGPIASPEQACTYGADPGSMNDHFSEGGTSLSSPLWLGMWTRVQAHHDAVDPATLAADPKASLGFANYAIYKLAQGGTTSHDFNDVTTGNNPLPAGPGWDFPTGWGSPNLTNLIADASGDKATAAVGAQSQADSDPAPIYAQAPSGAPSCPYVFYDPKGDATDGFTLQQDDQLDLIEGDFGLTPDGKSLRVVMSIANLSKDIPTGSSYLDYEFYWNYTPAGASSPTPYAVDVQVDSSGNVTFADGTMTVTDTGGTQNYQFSANANGHATGSFGSGPNGRIEVDVPPADIGNPQPGDALKGGSAYTADGDVAFGFIADQAGPGADYHLGDATCVDPGTAGAESVASPRSGDSAAPAPSSGGSGAVQGTKTTHVVRRYTAHRHKAKHRRRHRVKHHAKRRHHHRGRRR